MVLGQSKFLWFAMAAFFLAIANGQEAGACLNSYGHRHQYQEERENRIRTAYLDWLVAEKHAPSEDELENSRRAAESGSFRNRSDYAVVLLRAGRTREGLETLKPLAAEHPTEFPIAGNLGTAYELAGDNENALKWIRKEIELNADSHEGTEWLHVNILRAKIRLADDPNWLGSHSIIALDTEGDSSGRSKTTDELGNQYDHDQIIKALEYQLHERLALVAAPDPICAELLITLGSLLRVSPDGLIKAKAAFELAVAYSGESASANRATSSLKSLNWKIWRRDARDFLLGAPLEPGTWVISFVVVLLFAGIRRAFRRIRPVTRSSPT